MIAAEVLTGGFSEPVFQSQAVFRKVLDAFAHPGRVVAIPPVVSAPAPLYQSTAALLCAFADEGTPVHFEASLAETPASAWVRFHTGAPTTEERARAEFAIVTHSESLPAFEDFALGTQEYPDRSTTIVIQIKDFSGGERFRLEGPGIDGAAEAGVMPMPHDFLPAMARNRVLFPRGVDLVLASPDALLALPRSVRLTALRRP